MEVALEVLDVLIVLCLGSGFGIMPWKKTLLRTLIEKKNLGLSEPAVFWG